jgi:hypothetical protein
MKPKLFCNFLLFQQPIIKSFRSLSKSDSASIDILINIVINIINILLLYYYVSLRRIDYLMNSRTNEGTFWGTKKVFV